MNFPNLFASGNIDGCNLKKVIAVGDAASPGNIGSALRSATEAALNMRPLQNAPFCPISVPAP